HQRLYDYGATPAESLKSVVPYSAMDSPSYQSLLSLRSSTIPPKACVSLRAFSTTVPSSLCSSGSSIFSGASQATSARGPAAGPVLSAPVPIFSIKARRKRCAEFFQAEYLPVEIWRATKTRSK
ncbi:hypothetical protein PFISCL1PPCAC_697, partial [Pristionchus fissidentatus]